MSLLPGRRISAPTGRASARRRSPPPAGRPATTLHRRRPALVDAVACDLGAHRAGQAVRKATPLVAEVDRDQTEAFACFRGSSPPNESTETAARTRKSRSMARQTLARAPGVTRLGDGLVVENSDAVQAQPAQQPPLRERTDRIRARQER